MSSLGTYECYGCGDVFEYDQGYECWHCDWSACRACRKGEFGKQSCPDNPTGHDWDNSKEER